MNLRGILALILIFPATLALAADGSFDKTLSLDGTATLSISSGSGYIHVYSGPGDQVHITGHVHANPSWFSSDADQRVKRIVASPPVTQSGNTIRVGAGLSDSGLFNNISIDYDVTAPRATILTANTGSGGIEIGGIEGTVSAETGSGSIHADNIGANARLQTGSGRIQATNVRGAANLQAGSGSIELSLAAPGDVKAQTGSGSIHIDGLSGGLRAGTGSGSVEIAGNPTSEWRIESGSGSIHVHTPTNARFTLNAETGSGSIQSARPMIMQGDLNRHHVVGGVNGGGPTLRAETGSGSISLD
jgi:hypothetical protein